VQQDKAMKIDQKIFYVSFVIVLLLNVVFYLYIPKFSISNFEILEESAAILEANNMRYFFAKEISSLDSLNKEWSRRDDVYKVFTSNEKDREYLISAKFDYEYIKDFKIDYLSFVTNKGKLLYNTEMGDNSSMPNEFAVGLTSSAIINKGAGLVRSWNSDDIMAVSIRPVSLNNSSTPVGYIIMTKRFAKNVVAYSGKSSSFNLVDGAVYSKLLAAKNNIYIDKKSMDNVFVYSFYDNILGEKSFYSKSIMPRDIYKAGLSTVSAISYCGFVLQLLMIIAFLFVSQRLVISRLKLLTASINMIAKSKKRDPVVILDGNDEISILSREINDAFVRINNEKNKFSDRQQDLDLTIKSMHDTLLVLDEKNKIVFSYFPKVREVDKNIFISQKFISKISNEIDDIKNNGGAKNIDYSASINKKKYWYNINISIKKGVDGGFGGLILIVRDITENKQMQEKTEEKIKELERLNKLMTDRELKMIELKKRIKELEK